jgi:hypothetical protein
MERSWDNDSLKPQADQGNNIADNYAVLCGHHLSAKFDIVKSLFY